MPSIRTALAAAALIGVACIPAAATPVPPEPSAVPRPVPAAPKKPTLIVFITIDQLRTDYLSTRFRGQLTGGLKRLIDGGAFYVNGVHDHAITETAPGHSATMSGRFPVHTGIVMNSQGVNTPDAPLIAGARGPGASPFRFQGTTLTDWLKRADGRTKVLSVSRKDRGAILPIGKSKEPIFWFASGRFTTSTYYADQLPDWVQKFNDRRLPEKTAGREWTLLMPAAQYAEPDSVPRESNGTDFVFPHLASEDSTEAAATLAGFPWMDDVTLQLALTGVEALQLGRGPQTDLLNVSLSTLDAVGHRFGPDSREVHDMVLRADRMLGVFIDSLYKLRDSSEIVFALTGDHGVAPLIGVKSADPSQGGQLVSLKPAVAHLAAALAQAKLDTMAFGFDDGILVIDQRLRRENDSAVEKAVAAFMLEARATPGVLRVDKLRDLARSDTVNDNVARRWLHMFEPTGTNVEAVVTMTPYSYWQGVTYATHGTPHDYDTHVPVLLYGAGVSPGQRTEPARVVDLAPTLAAIVGVRPLEKLDGVVLKSALQP